MQRRENGVVTRVKVKREMMVWARERAGLETAELEHRFPKISAWETEEIQPTIKQLEDFARAVHVPFGYLLLPEPPEEPLPIPDFRTMDGHAIRRPSPELLDMVYACQERQGWYKEFSLTTRQPESEFV